MTDFSSSLPNFIWVDYCIMALVALSAIIGMNRGIIREVFSLTLWIAAGWLALQYNHDVSSLLESRIPLTSVRLGVSFLVIFIAVLILGGMLSILLGKLVTTTGLGGTDRLAGLLFGVARGLLIASVLVLLAGVTPLPQTPWWKKSSLIPPFQSMAQWLRETAPAGLAGQVKFPEASVKKR